MKIFIDCGYYMGKALDYYAPLMDKSWTVYAFEPNTELEIDTSRFPFEVEVIRKAVWTEDGEVEFRVGERNDASHIDTIRTSTNKKVTVPSIDFSKFVAELPRHTDTIICSMDIEGAEFPVLKKMLAEGTAQRIALLDIEFHHRIISELTEADASTLRQELEAEGVLVKLKLEL